MGKMKFLLKILPVLFFVSLGLNIVLYMQSAELRTAKSIPEKNSVSTYSFLSPRIFAEHQNDIIINFMNLRQTFRADVASFPFKVGLYFEYLPSGTSIGINEKEEFAIASLLKVPLALATYEAVDDGVLRLDQELVIRQSDLDAKFGELYKKGAGYPITTQEAMRLSLVESDNTAKNLLLASIPLKYLEDVFDSLDIPKDSNNSTVLVSPKGYSSILRSLYLSSYVSYERSNQILTWLTQTPFNDKIAAPIPPDVPVAHKIGSFETRDGKSDVFTDCGITYVPKRPYILCVMVQGNEEQAKNAMQFIALHAYEYVKMANHIKKETP